MGEAKLALLVYGTDAGMLRGEDLVGHQLCMSCDWWPVLAHGMFGYISIGLGKYSRFALAADQEVCPAYSICYHQLHVSSRVLLTAGMLYRALSPLDVRYPGNKGRLYEIVE